MSELPYWGSQLWHWALLIGACGWVLVENVRMEIDRARRIRAKRNR